MRGTRAAPHFMLWSDPQTLAEVFGQCQRALGAVWWLVSMWSMTCCVSPWEKGTHSRVQRDPGLLWAFRASSVSNPYALGFITVKVEIICTSEQHCMDKSINHEITDGRCKRTAKDSFYGSTLPGTNTFLDPIFSPSLKITSKLLFIILLKLLMGHPHQYQLHLRLTGKGGVRPPVLSTLTWATLGYCLALAWQMSREQQLLLVCIINTDLNQLVFRVCLAARADHY